MAPNGLAEVRAFYGDPMVFLREDGTVSPLWESRMVIVPFPQPLPLGWNKSVLAKGARVNQAVAGETEQVFKSIHREGLWPRLRTYDGAYAFRLQRGSLTKPSMHSYGAALDFNAETNQLGWVPSDPPGLKNAIGPNRADMDPGVVQVFESFGWTWGGRWKRPDGMHFQFAKGV